LCFCNYNFQPVGKKVNKNDLEKAVKGTHPLLNYHNGKNALNQLRVIFKPFELKLSFPDAIREMKKYSEEQVEMLKNTFLRQ